MTPARAWQWIIATRARRSALTLAVLAAIASPFATGWYDPNETDYQRHVDASEEERARIIELWGKDLPTADCEQLTEQLAQRELPARFKDKNQSLYEYWWKDERERKNWCLGNQTFLKYGRWETDQFISLLLYVTINGAVMLATLVATFFALTAAMAAARKWWRWWW